MKRTVDWRRLGISISTASVYAASKVLDDPKSTPEEKQGAALVGLLGFFGGAVVAILAPPVRYWKDSRGVVYRLLP